MKIKEYNRKLNIDTSRKNKNKIQLYQSLHQKLLTCSLDEDYSNIKYKIHVIATREMAATRNYRRCD